MDTSVTLHAPAAPLTAVPDEPKRSQITGKVAKALDALVWLGLPRAAAAAHAGMTEHGLYKALRKPPVKAAYLAMCEDLRLSGRARRIRRLEEISEQSDNLAAAVRATTALDHDSVADVLHARGQLAQSPGMLLSIVTHVHQTAPPATSPQPAALPMHTVGSTTDDTER